MSFRSEAKLRRHRLERFRKNTKSVVVATRTNPVPRMSQLRARLNPSLKRRRKRRQRRTERQPRREKKRRSPKPIVLRKQLAKRPRRSPKRPRRRKNHRLRGHVRAVALLVVPSAVLLRRPRRPRRKKDLRRRQRRRRSDLSYIAVAPPRYLCCSWYCDVCLVFAICFIGSDMEAGASNTLKLLDVMLVNLVFLMCNNDETY